MCAVQLSYKTATPENQAQRFFTGGNEMDCGSVEMQGQFFVAQTLGLYGAILKDSHCPP